MFTDNPVPMDASNLFIIPSENLKQMFSPLMENEHFTNDFKQDLVVFESKGILSFKIIQKIKQLLEESENVYYLHELLNGCEIFVAPLEVPPRNVELDIRVKQLKQQQEEKEYQRMVSNVATTSSDAFNFSREVKAIRAQLSVIANFVLTVGGSFMFAYKAVEYSLDKPNISAQVSAGLTVALCVAIADLYFIIKSF